MDLNVNEKWKLKLAKPQDEVIIEIPKKLNDRLDFENTCKLAKFLSTVETDACFDIYIYDEGEKGALEDHNNLSCFVKRGEPLKDLTILRTSVHNTIGDYTYVDLPSCASIPIVTHIVNYLSKSMDRTAIKDCCQFAIVVNSLVDDVEGLSFVYPTTTSNGDAYFVDFSKNYLGNANNFICATNNEDYGVLYNSRKYADKQLANHLVNFLYVTKGSMHVTFWVDSPSGKGRELLRAVYNKPVWDEPIIITDISSPSCPSKYEQCANSSSSEEAQTYLKLTTEFMTNLLSKYQIDTF